MDNSRVSLNVSPQRFCQVESSSSNVWKKESLFRGSYHFYNLCGAKPVVDCVSTTNEYFIHKSVTSPEEEIGLEGRVPVPHTQGDLLLRPLCFVPCVPGGRPGVLGPSPRFRRVYGPRTGDLVPEKTFTSTLSHSRPRQRRREKHLSILLLTPISS